jgi:hypothetical protein
MRVERRGAMNRNAMGKKGILLLVLLLSLYLAFPVLADEIDCIVTLNCTAIGGCGSDYFHTNGCKISCGLKANGGVTYEEVDCGAKRI